jgi:regulator of replication initiation timing
MIGLTTLLVWKRTQELNIERSNNAFVNAFRFLRRQKVDGISDQTIEEDEYDSDDSIEPPSTEEELEFLGSFKAANPTSRERISKTIAGGRSRRWGFKSQNPAKQRQRSIKSIQKWWRQRPSTSVTIIEPKHVHNQQPMPSSQRISQLQNQLAQSEQERAVLQLDVQRLQQRLQKAHHDARAIVAKNEWLEKQQSKGEKITISYFVSHRLTDHNMLTLFQFHIKLIKY